MSAFGGGSDHEGLGEEEEEEDVDDDDDGKDQLRWCFDARGRTPRDVAKLFSRKVRRRWGSVEDEEEEGGDGGDGWSLAMGIDDGYCSYGYGACGDRIYI
jgi:hypothetical protein